MSKSTKKIPSAGTGKDPKHTDRVMGLKADKLSVACKNVTIRVAGKSTVIKSVCFDSKTQKVMSDIYKRRKALFDALAEH